MTHLPSADFQIETLRSWKSPVTGANYPVSVRIKTHEANSSAPKKFTLEPLAENQELDGGGIPYWEGACRVRDEAGAEIGSAYLELTGYSDNFQKNFR